MVGIKKIAVHLPYYRLSKKTIGAAWGTAAGAGERRVANFDEDSVTMAIEAGFKCLKQENRDEIKGLYFGSTTAPYLEKQCAAICAGVLDVPSDIRTCDFGGSTRASTDALLAAADAVKAGLGNILVVTADCRPALPRSPLEGIFGDGGAAVLLGDSDVICHINDSYSAWNDITDIWRMDKDAFVKTWEDRYTIQMGYEKDMVHSISTIMERNNLQADKIAKLVLYSPEGKSHLGLAKKLGFKTEQIQDPLANSIGNTGSTQVLMALASVLAQAKPGEKIICANFGSGSDVLLLTVSDEMEKKQSLSVTGPALDMGKELSYQKYLDFRGFVQTPQELVRLFPSASVMFRTRKWATALHGSKCNECGVTTFPIQRVCYSCKSKDNFEEVRLVDKKGAVYALSLDNLAGGPNPPTVQTIVETEDGARIYCLMTDCEPEEINIGTPVEMTYRKFHEEGGFYNYYWKCRPVK
ncbi:MAG: 3-oxoacyl-[acyl-carrier-protein] synthase III C-terminal domain-containing protein [Syntrophales bacterium]